MVSTTTKVVKILTIWSLLIARGLFHMGFKVKALVDRHPGAYLRYVRSGWRAATQRLEVI
jgi:hypothetical protein